MPRGVGSICHASFCRVLFSRKPRTNTPALRPPAPPWYSATETSIIYIGACAVPFWCYPVGPCCTLLSPVAVFLFPITKSAPLAQSMLFRQSTSILWMSPPLVLLHAGRSWAPGVSSPSTTRLHRPSERFFGVYGWLYVNTHPPTHPPHYDCPRNVALARRRRCQVRSSILICTTAECLRSRVDTCTKTLQLRIHTACPSARLPILFLLAKGAPYPSTPYFCEHLRINVSMHHSWINDG